jgi:signal transduction histidine kinase
MTVSPPMNQDSQPISRWNGLRVLRERIPTIIPWLLSYVSIPSPDPEALIGRVLVMERHIILPLKAALIAMLLQRFYSSPWMGEVSSILDIAIEGIRVFLWIYIGVNAAVACILLAIKRLPLPVVEWTVFVVSLVDGIFLGALTLATGGYDSILYWLFVGLIVRSAVSVPRATSQLTLNFTLTACYVLAGTIDLKVAELLDETSRRALEWSEPPENPTETILLRLALLVLMAISCYAVQVLLVRQKRIEEEAREFAFREGQLRSAGRLAAEFAHQIKNPLAIINNALFSLQRALKQGRNNVEEQIRIIQEEVNQSDRIITQVMGYAQLSEGRVERLDVVEELNLAIARVFPPAAGYPTEVKRDFAGVFPPLLMQRRHLSESFINVLQNAREAAPDQGGKVRVQARCLEDQSVQVIIEDNGPGIPADRLERVFQAYYTTKEKGTGLGLATVKNNVELYGGKVRVESELGKGARFILSFPAKTLVTATGST